MKKGFIIGIHGRAGSGKDSLAKLLSTENTTTIAFADKMKQNARDVYGFSDEQLWGESELRSVPSKKHLEKGITLIPRDVLIGWGTAGRNIYINTWVDYVETIIHTIYKTPQYLTYDRKQGLINSTNKPRRWYTMCEAIDKTTIRNVIVSDLRFQNEYEMIKKNNGITIKIKRDGAGLKGDHGKHESEAGLPDELFDFVIDNNKPFEELEKKANEIKEKVYDKRSSRIFADALIKELNNPITDYLNFYDENDNEIPQEVIDNKIKEVSNNINLPEFEKVVQQAMEHLVETKKRIVEPEPY